MGYLDNIRRPLPTPHKQKVTCRFCGEAFDEDPKKPGLRDVCTGSKCAAKGAALRKEVATYKGKVAYSGKHSADQELELTKNAREAEAFNKAQRRHSATASIGVSSYSREQDLASYNKYDTELHQRQSTMFLKSDADVGTFSSLGLDPTGAKKSRKGKHYNRDKEGKFNEVDELRSDNFLLGDAPPAKKSRKGKPSKQDASITGITSGRPGGSAGFGV